MNETVYYKVISGIIIEEFENMDDNLMKYSYNFSKLANEDNCQATWRNATRAEVQKRFEER